MNFHSLPDSLFPSVLPRRRLHLPALIWIGFEGRREANWSDAWKRMTRTLEGFKIGLRVVMHLPLLTIPWWWSGAVGTIELVGPSLTVLWTMLIDRRHPNPSLTTSRTPNLYSTASIFRITWTSSWFKSAQAICFHRRFEPRRSIHWPGQMFE